ncbi:hypothetical protein COW36_09660 [bacterium (Candidatus Blackallbacteria) CG17_big_fil_post_rev_8_21_14_2_50_48_46]|uniref:Mercuric transport protein MerT n=1 Tax=bacterium (Candidatus Blackallbacteria) CG17_big_fil_post_rev_8_21_14_2_50_48_46 TaxID=2014261 RepID=A0A2M7G5U7_9BACT|nr:MAG: hypothetical protein COW64_01750 [bacterium (Candidatus Blackallbacteria) CG18_big_fil_WC_8_21_14_2_50_49_26]PIW17227.1 MAG: hypothetical protein COW36_09660 [bacterium (Candidatus Blackallbacteria) CG17_big_fil_post_rev_8_21_14_2_50_48_46]PIW51018.1 MAG: hypothetical protein COW20_00670 [bacterium (Candidatus Blackallbacteria) CG13_big_fil_rev_8_21_14_2_50_49_14]
MSVQNKNQSEELPAWSFWGTVVSAVAAQACCGLPWLLLTLGASSSFVSQLNLLKPYRPLFVAAAFLFLIAGFWQVWQARKRGWTCKPRIKA